MEGNGTNGQFSSRSLSGKVTVPNTEVQIGRIMKQKVNSAVEAYQVYGRGHTSTQNLGFLFSYSFLKFPLFHISSFLFVFVGVVVIVVVHTFLVGLTFERLDQFASYLERS